LSNAQHPYTQKLLAAIPSGQKAADARSAEPLIRIDSLKTWFTPPQVPNPVKAVDDVTLEIHRGEVLGLGGRIRQRQIDAGALDFAAGAHYRRQIDFDGTELSSLEGNSLKQFRHRMQMIFRIPMRH
jgi:oligopeptide transport system ATP-binding protein